MMKAYALLLPVLSFVGGCGGGDKPATDPSGSSTAPSSASSSASSSSSSSSPTSSSSSSAATSSSGGACFATFTNKKPAGWVETGKLVLTVKDKMPVAYEVIDASGKKVDSGDIDTKTGARKAAEATAEKTCKVGGVLVVYESEPAADATSMTAIIMKPAKEDEAADLAAFCKEPPMIASNKSLDDSQKVVVAMELYDESLTSSKWRSWLRDMRNTMRKSDDSARPGIRHAKATDLESASKSKDCWFATLLKK